MDDFPEPAGNHEKLVIGAHLDRRAGGRGALRSISLDFWDFVELGTGNTEFLQAVGDRVEDVKSPRGGGLNVNNLRLDGSDRFHSKISFFIVCEISVV